MRRREEEEEEEEEEAEAEDGESAAASSSAASSAAVAAPSSPPARLQLLRFLTDLEISGRNVLELFASGRLHLDRFVSHTRNDWLVLLHVQVVELLRSGWLSEDALFRLHDTLYCGPGLLAIDKPSLLRLFLNTEVFTLVTETFLPLTAACVEQLSKIEPWAVFANQRRPHYNLRTICELARRAFGGEGEQPVPRTTLSGWLSSQQPAAPAAAAAAATSSAAPPPPPPSQPKRPRSPSFTSPEPALKRAYQDSSAAAAAPGHQQSAAAASSEQHQQPDPLVD